MYVIFCLIGCFSQCDLISFFAILMEFAFLLALGALFHSLVALPMNVYYSGQRESQFVSPHDHLFSAQKSESGKYLYKDNFQNTAIYLAY